MARPRKNAAKAQDCLLTPEKVAEIPVEEQPYPLPEGWKWVRLGDYNYYVSETINPALFKENTFELYSVPSSSFNYPEILLGKEIGSSKQSVEPGDVLLCKINPRINRVWQVSGYTNNKLIASSEWIIFRNKNILSSYIMYCMKSEYFREYMLSNISGVGGSLMRAQPKYVRRYPIPLPPIDEQQRIVDRIESLFAKLDEAREKAEAVRDGFESRKAAILHKAFTGELTAKWRNEKGIDKRTWKERDFSYVIKKIEAGKNIRCEERPPQKNEIGIVKVSAVTWGFFNENESKTCNDISLYNKSIQIKTGDFLFSRANTIQLVGNCVIVRDVNKKIMLSDKILRLTINDNVYNKYILYFSMSTMYRNQIVNLASGNQDGMRNISQKNLLKIRIMLPMKEEQQEIVRILDTLFEKERQVKEAAEDVLERIDLMKKAILAKAFRGELTRRQ